MERTTMSGTAPQASARVPCEECAPGTLGEAEARVSRRAYRGKALCYACQRRRNALAADAPLFTD